MQITNCHTHIFTRDIVPEKFLPQPLRLIANWLDNDRFASTLLRITDRKLFEHAHHVLHKYINFVNTGGLKTQAEIFDHLQGFYPAGTRFIILPMDMKYMGGGNVKMDLEQQLDELAAIKRKSPDVILPFVFAHPERPNLLDLVKKYIEEHNFAGIKMYPALGYFPDDKRLFPVYEYAEEKGIPVMTHCSRGGVYYLGKITGEMRKNALPQYIDVKPNHKFCNQFSEPRNYISVLEKYTKLKLCLAHFGGDTEWNKFLDGSYQHQTSNNNWFSEIRDMMKKYPNLYTDVSYTHAYSRFQPLMKNIIETDTAINSRILFGTDFYMTEQEESEREHSIRFRSFLGENLFSLIAEHNPKTYL